MEKLFIIITLLQTTFGKWLFQQSFPGRLIIAGLTLVTSLLVTATLLTGLYAAHAGLLQLGLQPSGAIILTLVLALLIILALLAVTFRCLHHFRDMPQAQTQQSPITSIAIGVLTAFLDGLTTKDHQA